MDVLTLTEENLSSIANMDLIYWSVCLGEARGVKVVDGFLTLFCQLLVHFIKST